jgi:hypothetical protein
VAADMETRDVQIVNNTAGQDLRQFPAAGAG